MTIRATAGAGLGLVALLTACASEGTLDTVGTPPTAGADEITGVVFVDVDGDGLIGASDRPFVTQLHITVDGSRLAGSSNTTTTGPDGSFAFTLGPDTPSSGLALDIDLEANPPGRRGAPAVAQIRLLAAPGDRLEIPVPDLDVCSVECGEQLLPDLRPVLVAPPGAPPTSPGPADSLRLDTTTEAGRVLLRFASIVANEGPGPLHVIADPATMSGTPDAWQRTYSTTGSVVDHPTGALVFHDQHDHFHLDRFESYRLVEDTEDGAVVRSAHKVSFCLTDSLDHRRGRAPEREVRVHTPPLECGERSQSINPGWSDHYGADLPDQWVDVTDVPDGDYLLEFEVDPDGIIVESDENNNIARLPIRLAGGSVVVRSG